jgi:autotransporter-associated beta strand protein
MFYLGANELTVGSNNLSTTVTGLIDDGGLGGSLVKVGTGTLTLAGYNSFYGGVTLNAGTLKLANNGALGYGVLSTLGGNVAYADGVTIGNAVDLRANTTLDVAAGSATQSGVVGETGGAFGFTKTGIGTLTLSGTNTYTGGTTFAGGTVSVSSDANLGDAAGSLTFNGGSLQVTGTAFTSTARAITLGAGGGTFDIANAANSFSVTQGMTGTGGLTKTGAGTLILSGANTYTGATTVSAGILDIQDSIASSTVTNNATLNYSDSATAGSASITNNNQLTFYGHTSAGSAVITNYGTVLFDGNSTAGSAQLINSGSSAVINFWTPGPASDGRITAGSLAGDGRFDLNSVELTVGSDNLSTEVTGVLTGDGLVTGTSLIKTGTGTLTLSGTNTYTGATVVDGGTLSVNGSIAASSGVTVNSGGALGGTGTVGATTIASGGALAPGNSIGTLTVNGNLSFNAGSFYTVEVSPTAADRTDVIGIATLTGATVQAVALPGSFRQQTYTILTAAGGFAGTEFAGITGSSFAPGARNPHLAYDANNVFLLLDPGAIQLPAGASGNQSNVAGGINRFVEGGGTPPAAFDALLNMSGARLTNALDQVSGQPAAAGQEAAYNASNQFMTAMFDPFAYGRGLAGSSAMGDASKPAPPGRSSLGALSAETPRDVLSDPHLRYWGTVYGGNTSTNGSGGAGDTSSRTYGIVTGADYMLSPDTMLGFALGGGQSSFGVSDGLGGGDANMVQTGIFAKHDIGAAYVFAGLSYTYQDVTTNRTVTVSGSDELEAKFDANTFGGRIEGGYRYATPFVGITPYAALQVTQINLPGYEESAISGSNAFALDHESNATTITRTELGARFDRAFKLDDALLTLRSRIAWAHDEGNDSAVSASFLSLPGSAFTVNGAVPSKDLALVSAGAEMKWLNDISIVGTFEGEFSENTVGYAGKGAVRLAW